MPFYTFAHESAMSFCLQIGIHRVEFREAGNPPKLQIEAVVSQENEVVLLDQPVSVIQEVETWLTQLANEVQKTLQKMTEKCSNREISDDDLKQLPSQVRFVAQINSSS